MSKDRIELSNDDQGKTPDKPMGFAEAIWSDLIKGDTGIKVMQGLKSEFALLTRGENVKAYSDVSLARLQAAWVGNDGDVYDS